MRPEFSTFGRSFAVAVLIAIPLASQADPVSVGDAFHYRFQNSANPGGFPTGDRLAFGADDVAPSGALGTLGIANQDAVSVGLFYRPFDIFPTQFIASVPYASVLTDPWTLTFTNGPDSTVVNTPSVGTVGLIPFVSGFSASGSLLTPTLTWTLPSTAGLNVTIDAVAVAVVDLNDFLTLSNGTTTVSQANAIFVTGNLGSGATSFTLPTGVLEPGGRYGLQVILNDFRPGLPAEISPNARTLSRSNTFILYAVPEPASLILTLTGLAAMFLGRWRRIF